MDYSLSLSNIEFLKKEIRRSGITFSHLRDDLIDHVCCDVECEMRNGLPFTKAYEMVKAKIGIGGLESIQQETLYLIDKKYRIMKNTMKISGVIAPIIMAFGSLFKIEHWPGASILLVLGFFLLSFVFLPSAIYVSYKEVSNRANKWTHFMGFFGTFFMTVGFLFKLNHWPGAEIAMLLGFILISLVFLPMVMINKFREKEVAVPKYVFAIALCGMMLYLAAFLFKMMHWPFATVLMLAGGVLLVFIAFPVYVIRTYKEQKNVSGSFIFLVVALVWFVVPISLISLNVSTNVLRAAYETNRYMDTDLKFIQDRNSSLQAELQDNPRAIAVKNSANELLAFIQSIKAEMVKKLNRSNAVSANNEILMSRIRGNRPSGLYNTVLFKNKQEIRLKELLRKFGDEALAVSSDSEYTSVIGKTLEYKVYPEDNPEDDLLISLNKLSFLQLNVCLVEQTALIQLRHLRQAGI